MISYLSDLITIGSQKLASFIILLLPFTTTYLTVGPEVIMLIVGFGGQALFASRFIIQWISSESAGRSIIPIGFWYCSVGGGAVFIYAIWREDPVFICGQDLDYLSILEIYILFSKRKKQMEL